MFRISPLAPYLGLESWFFLSRILGLVSCEHILEVACGYHKYSIVQHNWAFKYKPSVQIIM